MCDIKIPVVEVVWNMLREDSVFLEIIKKAFNDQSPTNEQLKQQFCYTPIVYLGLARQQGYNLVILKKYLKMIFQDSINILIENNRELKTK